MQKELKNIIFDICKLDTVCGNESLNSKRIAECFSEYAGVDAHVDNSSNITVNLGNPNGKHHIMLEAHLDQVGFIVTDIDKDGFIKFAPCGGVDKRILPSTDVQIFGKKTIAGTIGCKTPHLVSGEKKFAEDISDLFIDTGLTKEKVESIVSLGDYISFDTEPIELLNDKIACKSLDNKAGIIATLICAKNLSKLNLKYKLSILLGIQEEVSALGSKTKTFELVPDESIVLDTSFAKQANMENITTGELGGGPMIGISPILNKHITDNIINIAKENKINYKLEVMGALTSTDADKITVSQEGVKTALLSIPIRYMHTPVEVVSIKDIENTSKLLTAYLMNRNEGEDIYA